MEDTQTSDFNSQDSEFNSQDKLSEVESIHYDSDDNRRTHEVPGKKSSLWAMLKPQTKDRLFHVILNSPNLTDSVKMWLSEYNADKERITDFIQLIVDVASYQSFDVEDFIHEHEITQLVPFLENIENTVVKQTGKYFLKCNTKLYTSKQQKVAAFIITTVKEFGLHYRLFECTHSFNKYCFRIIKDMCKSKRRSIRHAGFFTGVKYMTGVVELLYEINIKMDECTREAAEEQNEEQRTRLRSRYNRLTNIHARIRQFVQHLSGPLRDENLLSDTDLNILKKDFAEEIRKWVLTVPSIFLKLDTMKVLMSFLKNHNREVRMTALTELGKILEHLHREVSTNYHDIIKELNFRVYDIDMRIAGLAVSILSFLHDHEPSWISNDIRDSILGRVYSYDYTLASACGKFLISVFRVSANDVLGVINQLIKFEIASNYRGIYDRTPLLVEAVLDAEPALQDLAVYKTFLEKRELDENVLSVYVKIVAEVVHELTTGLCSYVRANSAKKNYNVDSLEIYTILEDIIIMLWNLKLSKPIILKPIALIYKKLYIENSSVSAANLVSTSSIRQ